MVYVDSEKQPGSGGVADMLSRGKLGTVIKDWPGEDGGLN